MSTPARFDAAFGDAVVLLGDDAFFTGDVLSLLGVFAFLLGDTFFFVGDGVACFFLGDDACLLADASLLADVAADVSSLGAIV